MVFRVDGRMPAYGERLCYRALAMSTLAIGAVGALFLCAGAPQALAQRTDTVARAQVEPAQQGHAGRAGRPIRLAGATIETDGPAAPLAQVAVDEAGAARPRIVQLDGPMSPERARRLAAAGVRVGEYLSSDAFVMRLDGADPEALRAIDFVAWSGEFDAAWKLDPGLGGRALATQARRNLAARGDVALSVWLFDGEEPGEAAQRIGAIPGARVERTESVGGQRYLTVVAPRNRVAQLAELDEVRYVEEFPEATLRNDTSRWIVQSNVPGVTPLYANGLAGEGQIIGIIDGLVNIQHCSFSDIVPVGPGHRKVVAYNAAQGSDVHGTHVAGTAVGDSGAFNNARGVAYLAKMAFNSIPTFTASSFLSRLQLHHNQGARVHSNSWGMDFREDYNVWCREADQFCWDNEDDLVLFACTNLLTLYTPENAKNVLAVGATKDTPNQGAHQFGGVGPTDDGRRKPEIYAPGEASLSSDAFSACGTRPSSGTSMAAPAIAGAAALAREYFVKGMHPTGAPNPSDGFTPTGALLRATIVNSAADMTAVAGYPSNLEGWGRVLIDSALYFPGDARRLLLWDQRNAAAGALTTGAAHEHPFTVVSSGEQLRVTMVFTDAPAAVGAVLAPVNDLDLRVVSPSGVVFRGNVFATSSPGVLNGQSAGDSLFNAVSGVEHDPLNNVEQVHVANPEPGDWQITIIGAAVNVGTQGYALVVTGAVEASQTNPCPADLTGDGQVTGADLALLLTAWGVPGAPADLNGDGTVNASDLGLLLTSWGPCD